MVDSLHRALGLTDEEASKIGEILQRVPIFRKTSQAETVKKYLSVFTKV